MYRHYLVGLLMVVVAFSYVDRMVFGMVLQEIKFDLQLTDTQLGFLGGIGFAAFFAVAGIPIARWADRGNRVTIVSVTTALCGVAVTACGAATSFAQLFLVRIGVAVGEAGCQPPAHSLIPDYFDRIERPRAVARYMVGAPVGLTIGYFAGGWLNQIYGWRLTFLIIGLPGLILAILAAWTMKEPRRAASATAHRISRRVPLKEVVSTLWRIPSFRHLMIAFLVWYFCAWGMVQWKPAFFIRSYGLGTGELGTWLAMTYGSSALLGTWMGGEWGARYAPRNEGMQLRVVSLLFASCFIFYGAMLLSTSLTVSMSALGVATLIGALTTGPLFATIQTLAPPQMRATAMALIGLLPSFVGAGLGPLAVGILSDALRPWSGTESVRYALMFVCPGFLWVAWHLWRASLTVRKDLVAVL